MRQLIGLQVLKKEIAVSQRKRRLSNLPSALNIALLIDATNPDNIETVKKYVNRLRQLKKNVKVLGYIDLKEMPQLNYLKPDYEFFYKKDVNWYLKPTSLAVQEFIDREFDILIDLNMDNILPLKYVAALSKSTYKVGQYSEGSKEVYDLMIDNSADTSLAYLIKQIDVYLNMMNATNQIKNNV